MVPQKFVQLISSSTSSYIFYTKLLNKKYYEIHKTISSIHWCVGVGKNDNFKGLNNYYTNGMWNFYQISLEILRLNDNHFKSTRVEQLLIYLTNCFT